MTGNQTIPELIGLVPVGIKQAEDEITFAFKGGATARFFHKQDCCESVTIESVTGDWESLLHIPIMVAENRTVEMNSMDGSSTATFYTFRGLGGTVDVRWFGESDGYYSEAVDFEFTPAPEAPPNPVPAARKYPLNVTLRNGRKAVVLGENPKHPEFALMGYTAENGEGHIWTDAGRWSTRGKHPEYDIVSGLDDPEPAPEAPRTVKVQMLVGVMSDGRYAGNGWTPGEDHDALLMASVADAMSDWGGSIRYTMIEADVPLPDEAIPTVQGRVVEAAQ